MSYLGTKNEKKEERPKSTGSVPDKSGDDKSGSSEPVDWLGLSRLGSPAEKKNETKPSAESSTSASTKNESEKSDDNWLGLGSSSRSSRSRSPPKATAEAGDDWLGMGTSRRSRGDSQSRSKSPENLIDKKASDWLDLGKDDKEDEADDWLSATLKSKKERKSSAAGDDWLGLNDTKSTKADSSDLQGVREDVDSGDLTRLLQLFVFMVFSFLSGVSIRFYSHNIPN